MNKLILLVIVDVLLSGCATNRYIERINDAEVFAQQQKWIEAYSVLEYNLIFNTESEKTSALIGKYPTIITIGMKDVYKQRLKEIEKQCSNANFYNYFCKIRDLGHIKSIVDTRKEILADSKKGLNDCAANPQAGVWLKNLEVEDVVGPDYFDENTKKQMAIAETKELAEEKAKTKDRTGIIISAQVANESHINTGAGANLGSAYAQARYIDNTNWKDYSATRQLGAGLAGAVMGGLMLDKPTTQAYRSTYFVKLFSGDIKQVEVVDSSSTHLPEGVCVEVYENQVNMVNQNNCAGLSPHP